MTILISYASLHSGLAFAEPIQTSLEAGLCFFPQGDAPLVPALGYFLHFQAEPRENTVRPFFATQIGFSSGTNRVIDGDFIAGVNVIGKNGSFVKPFISTGALFGWTHFAKAAEAYLGNTYGFLISAGAEIRFVNKDNASALRLTSAWRFLLGTIGGGLSGSDLNTLQLSIGMTF